jgi:hypothetical protein
VLAEVGLRWRRKRRATRSSATLRRSKVREPFLFLFPLARGLTVVADDFLALGDVSPEMEHK